ncbi:glycosyl transferase, WecB/TagA/CpsF family protein [Anabaenopsis circularis NIES-21]|uniref:Glycosyl transferase, WecB/TagA/CpsF family protein n=3 Tax=Nostocales TaxID=1161 RepID=A0A1Z4GJ16_9CYAN|nr:glycosyl transferase, WecB/TagA/CpsF family protein [Anabaenopsis circularis NIES-21]GBE90771.1 glycosyl transferase, WecB/TagA/CpsF family [Nostoc cycadae WK-1]
MVKMSNFPEVKVLDTRFHKLTVQDLISYIVEAGKVAQKTVIAHVNVRGMNFAYQLPWYRNFLNNADLVFCDGVGVLLGAKLLGYQMEPIHRMTCPDYIESLAIACEQNNISLFLLAGQPGVTDKAIKKLLAIAPNLRIDGHHGYFDKSGKDNDNVIEKINQFKPDVLYIGFGMPLQERWILDHFDKIDTRVFLPLGACLDFYTDSVYRGPRWLTDNGFEWLTRLVTEPTRLWERYIVGNPLFLYRVLKQRITQKVIANP